MRVVIAVLAVAALAGCGGGPFPEQEREVKAEVARYFAELNSEAAARAIDAKAASAQVDVPPAALTLSRFDWDIAGSIFPNVVCPGCKSELGTLATTGVDLKCPECGMALMEELARIGRAVPMFEIKSAQSLPIVIVVRYVRHVQVFDPNATVSVSAKTAATTPIDSYTTRERHDPKLYYANGFYRSAGDLLGVTGFVYRGGSLRQIDAKSIEQMTKDPPESVPVSSMTLGAAAPIETPIKPWIGKKPEAAGKAAPKPQ